MKKVLSMLLALVMVLVLMPAGIINVSAETSGDYQYTVTDGKATITGYTGDGGDVTIPSTLGDYPVTSIGDYAFAYCDDLTSLTFPNSITYVGFGAFADCYNLTAVCITDLAAWCEIEFYGTFTSQPLSYAGKLYLNGNLVTHLSIPNTVTSIGRRAFFGCTSLTSVSIPNSVTRIGDVAFETCSALTSVIIPEGVTSIGAAAFAYCDSLNSVSISSTVTHIGSGAFSACYNLSIIETHKNNTTYCSVDGVLFNKNETVLLQYPAGKAETTYNIPNSVSKIEASAFESCYNLASITIPSSVLSIGDWAFGQCTSLTSVTIPDGATSVGDCTFYECTSLASAILGDNVAFIGEGAFEGCTRLRNIVFTSSVKSIGDWAFSECTMLSRVLFVGTDNEWYNISIGSGNDNLLNNKTLHSHTSRVTCTEANICTGCGKTLSRPSGHAYKTTTTKATLKDNGNVVKKCTVCGDEASKTIIKKIKSINLSDIAYTYNGKAKKPSVTVKDSAGKKISSKYYTVTYAKGRKNVGTYKVTVTFKGNYSGKKELTFKINPPKTTVSKVTAAKKSLKVAIAKKTTQVTGYEVQYATAKSFKGAKTKVVKSAKTTSLTIKSLKAKKTYYVRVRTYKTVGGKKYYSAWSTAKSKKTK